MPTSFPRQTQAFAGNIAPRADLSIATQDPRTLSHAQLLLLRNTLAPDDPRQAELAPLEHAAFAQEWTRENPLVAAPALALAIPAYSAAKAVGYGNARTPGNISEVLEGYAGIGRGIRDRLHKGNPR